MNFSVLFNLLFLLGFSQAQFRSSEETDLATQLQFEENPHRVQEKRKVLKRAVRNTFNDLADKYIHVLEEAVIDNCKANGQQEAAEKLQSTFDEMMTCLNKKKILVTPREEFLALLEECTTEAIKQSRNCLAEALCYYPDLLFEYAKSLTNFLYDDYDIVHGDLVNCIPKLINVKVLTNYQKCVREISIGTKDSQEIPNTKAEFCRSFVPTAYCFANMIEEGCDRTTGLTKLREDYIKLHKNVCEDNETA